MSGFGDFARNARELEQALVRHGVALGIDWSDERAVRALAVEAMQCCRTGSIVEYMRSTDPHQRAKGQIFAMANLMLKLMTSSANTGVHTHGGPAWKAFARALYALDDAGGKPSE
ncbi:hypothetical protein G3580_03495 [Nitrogeniibacter mangrovi]|uniref:Uncharacterized protein n=1 Tax=Nitrogeniibacter mangrovi TaxID=2016596 RepID=A0A6C1B375_9RHOO|nr:hypothetical protein [Nitrogeniibacter mangrovi]QID16780.1 hypothetical protein G3580_03495 [Nitrogeniibacter mangrovi]